VAGKLIFELLEARFNGKIVENSAIIDYAVKNKDFARAWFYHAISSSLLHDELINCLLIAKYHNLNELELLFEYWPKLQFQKCQLLKASPHLVSKVPEINELLTEELTQLIQMLLPLPVSQNLGDSRVNLLDSKMNDEALQKVIGFAKEKLTDAKLYSEQQKHQKVDSIRNNDQHIVTLPVNDFFTALIQRYMCINNIFDLKYAEPAIIYRYKKGQQYKWHYDFITPSNSAAQKEIDFFGQRKKTIILNLNEGFKGGETAFKFWELEVSAKAGQLIQFNNMLDTKVDKSSVHSGKPVIDGEKWICTLWFREKPFWLRASIWNS
jgi:prolyl 4-hydroxylase|tara:strand:- start:74 stop:1042 length:969 start_codon:yes stop_codon:yes gene_type:complete